LVEHDLFGKPVSTFPDHALAIPPIWTPLVPAKAGTHLLAVLGFPLSRQ
jgi:hypothetical protein